MYNAIVIGTGPSGSLRAYHLERTGLHVLIPEQLRFPREKLCGGGVSHKAAQMLDGVIDLSKLPSVRLVGSYQSI
jgi:flavin-dependent dehydrogenase